MQFIGSQTHFNYPASAIILMVLMANIVSPIRANADGTGENQQGYLIDSYSTRQCRLFCMPRSMKGHPLHYFVSGTTFLACVDGCLCGAHCVAQMERSGGSGRTYAICYEACTASEPTANAELVDDSEGEDLQFVDY